MAERNDQTERTDKDAKPQPGDSAQEAIEKSGSVDTRIPEGPAVSPTSEAAIAGAPAAYVPQMGVGLPGGMPEDRGEGEAVLELERKAQRARGDIQRG